MKKTIISVAICASSIFANAQSSNYKLIEWEIFGMGVSVPFLTGLSAGPSFHAALRANVTDKIQVGVRWQGAIYASTSSIGLTGGYFLTGDYRFVNGYQDFRPFVGAGLGYVAGAGLAATATTLEATAGAGLGLQARAGFQWKFIRIAADYTQAVASGGISSLNLGLGLVLFGGKK